jgi:hypothetical protein
MADESTADTRGEAEEKTAGESNGNGTPHVELAMYQLRVTVRGAHDDDLDDVSDAARDLMDYLTEKSHELEERPDNRGLG